MPRSASHPQPGAVTRPDSKAASAATAEALDPSPSGRRSRFPASPMSGLVDAEVRYDLAESTCPPVSLGDLLRPEIVARLQQVNLGYGSTRGDAELRGLIAADVDVDPEHVLITPGSVSSLHLLALVLCDPGDHAVLVTPCFPPARSIPVALQVHVTAVALDFERGYRLDVDAIAAALTPTTRLVSLASPQNPSGIRFSEQELLELTDRVESIAPQAVVLVDETYRETVYGDQPTPPSAARLAPRIVTCSSLSKSHGVPALRVGWLTTTQRDLYEQLRMAKFTTLICCSTPDEILAAEVLRRREAILGPRRAALGATLDVLQHWAWRHRHLVDFLRPDGGALCCLRLREGRFDDAAVDRFHAALAERDTRVARGSWFADSDRVLRVGFGHLPPDLFEEALARLSDALNATAQLGPPGTA